MKIFASTLAVLLVAPAAAQDMSVMTQAFEIMRASANLNAIIDNWNSGGSQPVCGSPTDNYVTCVSVPDDIDDTEWVVHPVVPSGVTLGSLKGTPDYDLGLGKIAAMRDAAGVGECTETGKFAMATYPWLSQTDITAPITGTSLVKDFMNGYGADKSLSIWNIFTDSEITQGASIIYDFRPSSLSDDVEFPLFPMNPPPQEGGFYHIDVTENTITYTLVDNTGATDVVIPEGRTDAYYLILPNDVESVEVVSSDNIIVTATIAEAGPSPTIIDMFGSGLVFPETLGDNVIYIEIQVGTDLSEVGQQIKINYSLKEDLYICASGPLLEELVAPEPVVMEADTLITTSPHLNDMIPEFIWSEAPPGVDYDFFGSLEMCGGKANKIEWPEYFLEENISGAVFAYRQFGMSDKACGEEMAPLMRLLPGKVYKINFINSSESDTNLHTHGIHIGGNGYSDDVTRLIPAGQCGVYMWEVIDNHMAGMHWYHPHAHEWTFEQVRGRAFGPLWVEDMPERFATYPPSVQEWLKSTILIQMSSETVPGPMSGGDGVKDGRCPGGREACYPRANNKRTETVPMTKGEWKSVVFNMIVPNGTGMDVIQFYDKDGIGDAPCEILIAGYDGVYRSKVPRLASEYPEKPGFFHINGASRMQLAMKCSDHATMKLAKFDSTPQHYSIDEPEVPILVIFDVTDGPISIASPYADEATMTQWVPPRPEYLEDLTGWDGEVETWDLITEVIMEPFIQPVFNGQVFHGGAPNYVGTYGAVQEWSFYGSAGAPEGHPMHVHVNHMQILGHSNITGLDCGSNMEFGEWYDTIRVDDASHDPCMARFRFNNYSGKVILHCHDLMHEDAGMMGLVMVEGGPQDPFANDDPAPAIDCINVL